MSADVAKMYRQVELDPDHRDYHRILWRFNPTGPIDTYRMTRVTYGVASSSYHSIRALLECAKLNNVPNKVKESIERDFYVDDILTGAASKEEAEALQSGLINTLKRGQFDLKKWTCSDASVTLNLPPEFREANESFEFLDQNHTIKTLGLVWNPTSDEFSFKVAHLEKNSATDSMTKRQMLSDIAKIFDPLGWLSPITMTLKHLMQQVWTLKIDWDESLPQEVSEAYGRWRSLLSSLRKLTLKRFVMSESQQERVSLHVFCDASEIGYAACVYVVARDHQGGRKSTLLTGKTKVAPLKFQSIPRLELCAALLGSQLIDNVEQSLRKMHIVVEAKHAWTDSTIVLNWISCEPSNWVTFVANRVAKIQENSTISWNHVPTKENAADPASRGLDPPVLICNELWWHGPHWLITDEFPVPFCPQGTTEETRRSSKQAKTFLSQLPSTEKKQSTDVIDLSKYNSLKKVLRVVAYVKRFINAMKHKRVSRAIFVSTEEITEAVMIILRQEQSKYHSEEIAALQSGPQVKKSSKILKLYPLLYEGVLCVGGRLAQADLPDETKYPRIVPEKSELARLIIIDAHNATLHGGCNQVLAFIRTQYWIPRCRNQVRKLILNCVKCSRFTVKCKQPLMGDLPRERIEIPSRAFQDVGLDFGGPFITKTGSKILTKSYMAVFVCFASKAVHIEAVSDLTTGAFIASLRRFASRRGCPTTIYSDNGSNFTGAKVEIEALKAIIQDEHSDSLQATAAGLNIKWVFIPPRAPHFGGLWEAVIKSAKKHIRRIMGNSKLTFEELTTLFSQVEMVLNSRPISIISDDPKDDIILTPAHLCLGSKLEAIPSKQERTIKQLSTHSPTKRWFYIQNLLINFWKRWSKEYVSTLQERSKWNREVENLKVGDVVYVTDDNVPPLQWPLGRIWHVYSGPDQFVRVVKVKTSGGIYNRSVHKLRKLPLSEK